MLRRDFFGIVTTGALTVPVGSGAQRTEKLPRVALVFSAVPVVDMTGANPAESHARAFVHGMRDLGYIEGRNVIIERRSAEGRLERLPALMQELVELRVDVIVASASAALAAPRATDTIPIVMLLGNPVELGIVASLARPGRNVTGLTLDAAPTIDGKRLQLLKEAIPKASRVAMFSCRASGQICWNPETAAAARALQLTLLSVGGDKTEDIQRAFAEIVRDRPDALLAFNTSFIYGHRRQIIEFAAKQGLPAIYESREYVEAGGLMSYGANVDDLFRRAASYVDKILKGSKPGDLPIEQPTKFDLVINLKTAKALGLSIPQSLLLRADEVIE